MGKLSKIIFWLGILLLSVVGVLWNIRANQLSAHHIRTVYCGRVLADYWTTNPFTVRYQTRTNSTSQGVVIETVLVTNQLWSVWSIFK